MVSRLIVVGRPTAVSRLIVVGCAAAPILRNAACQALRGDGFWGCCAAQRSAAQGKPAHYESPLTTMIEKPYFSVITASASTSINHCGNDKPLTIIHEEGGGLWGKRSRKA